MEDTDQMRLQILTPSRKGLKPGQVFAFKYEDAYGFGRVVRTDAVVGAMDGCILIYVYKYISQDLTPPEKLRKEDLLIPPVIINKLPWSKGYLQVVEDRELRDEDTFDVHCFLNPFKKTFHNEYDVILKSSIEPVGRYGLSSYAMLDELITRSDFNQEALTLKE